MLRSTLTLLLTTAAMALSSLAIAQDLGNDEVTLKNGGLIRGTVVASEPGTSVKIIEAGESSPRVIPWSEVADVERGKYTTATPGPSGPGYAGPAPATPVEASPDDQAEPALGARGVVRLHVESPKPVRVFEHSAPVYGTVGGYGFAYESINPICDSPCDKVIDGRQGRTFSASGDFPGATTFELGNMQGDVDLVVNPGNRGLRTTGVVFTSLGGLGVAVGGSLALTAALINSASSDEPDSGLMTAGVGTLVGGAVVLTTGIVLMAVSGSSWDLRQAETGAARDSGGAMKPRYWMGEF